MAQAIQYPGSDIDWDGRAIADGHIELAGGLVVTPLTPLIGAEVTGIDLTSPLTDQAVDGLTQAFLRYKVLMIRSHGAWQMDADQHTRFCQQLSEHWGLRPDTEQKRRNHSEGLSVHPFLPWQSGYPHIWPTSSVTQGGQQSRLRAEQRVENFEPFEGRRRARKQKLAKQEESAEADKRLKPFNAGSYGAAALAEDTVMNGANGFHFDDGFFHQPPSAVVLNALVLPRLGGDTIFADMGAAFRGLGPELQSYAKTLTQTMDWTHTFPIWEEEAQRRAAEGDNEFRAHVEQLKADYPPSRQPVVRRHPVTCELSIYVNLGFTRHINDVSPEESRALIAKLCRLAERPEYQVRMRWQDVGDVCVYDNRITNHYAVADYGRVGPRALHHIALLGEPTADANGEVVG